MIKWLEVELVWWSDLGGREGSGAGRSEAERNISAQGGLTVGLVVGILDLEEFSFLTSMCLLKCLRGFLLCLWKCSPQPSSEETSIKEKRREEKGGKNNFNEETFSYVKVKL